MGIRLSEVPRRVRRLRGRALLGFIILCHRDDDMALFLSGFDISVGLGCLF
jgi:hypothetical protein